MDKFFQWKSVWNTGGFLVIFFSINCDTQSQIAQTEILWDHYGVPHIYGKNAEEMYHAFGWSQMQNHADLILQLYAEARGRASEYWGCNILNLIKRSGYCRYLSRQSAITQSKTPFISHTLMLFCVA